MDRAAYLDHYVRELELALGAVVTLNEGFATLPSNVRRIIADFLVPNTLVWNIFPVLRRADNDTANQFDLGHWLRPAFMAHWVAMQFRVRPEEEVARLRVRLSVLQDSETYVQGLIEEKARNFDILFQGVRRQVAALDA